jgi:hypothetical protein
MSTFDAFRAKPQRRTRRRPQWTTPLWLLPVSYSYSDITAERRRMYYSVDQILRRTGEAIRK